MFSLVPKKDTPMRMKAAKTSTSDTKHDNKVFSTKPTFITPQTKYSTTPFQVDISTPPKSHDKSQLQQQQQQQQQHSQKPPPQQYGFRIPPQQQQQQPPSYQNKFNFLRQNITLSAPSLPTALMEPEISTTKQVDPNKAVLAMLVDRSGSMASMGNEVSVGCNEYLDTQRKSDADLGTSTHVLFSVFDTVFDLVRDTPLSHQPRVTDADVSPRGGTSLYDSIAKIIEKTIESINKMTETPAQVGVFILTDGMENSSVLWSKEKIGEQIKLLEAPPYNWQFYFAAANQDAMAVGTSLCMKASHCVAYGQERSHMRAAFYSASTNFCLQKQSLPSHFRDDDRAGCDPTRGERDSNRARNLRN